MSSIPALIRFDHGLHGPELALAPNNAKFYLDFQITPFCDTFNFHKHDIDSVKKHIGENFESLGMANEYFEDSSIVYIRYTRSIVS